MPGLPFQRNFRGIHKENVSTAPSVVKKIPEITVFQFSKCMPSDIHFPLICKINYKNVGPVRPGKTLFKKVLCFYANFSLKETFKVKCAMLSLRMHSHLGLVLYESEMYNFQHVDQPGITTRTVLLLLLII